uniref:Uncharacterized protein n=1 Tax=Sphaerodactylus townsendi TaxID=933632 RepID=A0ACB8F730_9SAUR
MQAGPASAFDWKPDAGGLETLEEEAANSFLNWIALRDGRLALKSFLGHLFQGRPSAETCSAAEQKRHCELRRMHYLQACDIEAQWLLCRDVTGPNCTRSPPPKKTHPTLPSEWSHSSSLA